MKNEIKDAFVNARKTAGLDGSHKSLEKVHLNEIVSVAREIILDPKKAVEDHNSKMRCAANEVIKNLKAFFGRIDPNLDANAATITTLCEAGRHSNSHECLLSSPVLLLVLFNVALPCSLVIGSRTPV